MRFPNNFSNCHQPARLALAVALALGVCAAAWAQRPEPSSSTPAAPAAATNELTRAEEFCRLEADWEAALDKFFNHAGLFTEKTASGGAVIQGDQLQVPRFAKVFLEFAEEHRRTPEALTALTWVCSMQGGDLREDVRRKQLERAVALLHEDHVADAALGAVFPYLGHELHIKRVQQFFEFAMSQSPQAELKGLATYHLARGLMYRAKNTAADNPDKVEAARLLEIVNAEFADLPATPKEELHFSNVILRAYSAENQLSNADDAANGTKPATLGEKATRDLYELRNLTAGKSAPELIARTLDGDEFRLSSQDRRAIVLVFTSVYCGPCVRMKPDLVRLLKIYPNDEIALLSVYGDDAEEVKQSKQAVDHPGAVNLNAKGWEGPSLDKWNVGPVPTIYVLDEKRTIRFKKIGLATLAELEAAVQEILDEKGG